MSSSADSDIPILKLSDKPAALQQQAYRIEKGDGSFLCPHPF